MTGHLEKIRVLKTPAIALKVRLRRARHTTFWIRLDPKALSHGKCAKFAQKMRPWDDAPTTVEPSEICLEKHMRRCLAEDL